MTLARKVFLLRLASLGLGGDLGDLLGRLAHLLGRLARLLGRPAPLVGLTLQLWQLAVGVVVALSRGVGVQEGAHREKLLAEDGVPELS